MSVSDIGLGPPAEAWTSRWEELRHRKTMVFPATLRSKDGTELPVEISTNHQIFEDREYVFALARNISESKVFEAHIVLLNRLLRTSSRIKQVIVRESDQGVLLDEVCRILVEDDEFLACFIALSDRAAGMVTIAASNGVERSILDAMAAGCIQTGDDHCAACIAIRGDRVVTVEDLMAGVEPWHLAAQRLGACSAAAIPIDNSTDVIGALTVWARDQGVLDDDSLALLSDVAADLGFALRAIEERTARQWAQDKLQVSADILERINAATEVTEIVRLVSETLHVHTGFEAIGVRLCDGYDYPYHESRGFPSEFVKAETSLCAFDSDGDIIRDAIGNPVLECLCGVVINGCTVPERPFFTERGSFWTNSTTELLATCARDCQMRTRNRCNGEGYESVGLIPLRSGSETIGLLQLNDRRCGRFTPELIHWLEEIGDSLGVAIGRALAEESLRQQKERTQSYLDMAGTALIALAADETITMINRAGCSLLGYQERELVGKNWFDHCLRRSEREAVRAVFRQLFAGEITPHDGYESQVLTSDGELRRVAWSTSVLRDEDGHIAGTLSSGKDVTERRVAQQELDRRSEVINATNRLLHVALTCSSDDDYARLFLSMAEELTSSSFGFVAEVNDDGRLDCLAISDSVRDACQIPSIQEVALLRGMAVRGQLAEVIARGSPVVDNEPGALAAAVDFPDGHLLLSCCLAVPLRRQERTLGLIVLANKEYGYSVRDLESIEALANVFTQALGSLRAQRRIQESEERYRVVMESMTDGALLLDPDGIYLMVNQRLCETTGKRADELLGNRIWDLFPGLEESGFGTMVHEVFRTGETLTQVHEWKYENGRSVWHENRGYRVREGVFVITSDITELRNAEVQLRQSQKMEAIGRLAGGVAHDFNNLLQVITMYCDLALAELHTGDPLIEHISEIRTAAERSDDLTRQLLAFSRRQTLTPVVIDLNRNIDTMSDMLSRLVGEDVLVSTVLAPDLGRIMADPGQIEQVVLNLAINAREAMPTGGTLTIETANVDLGEEYTLTHSEVTPGSYVMLALSDSGHGMSRAIRSQIFDPFFTTKRSGTGLGLSTVFGIVKQSGGHIFCSSEPLQGTTFKIYLPRIESEATTSATKPVVTAQGGTETVLLTEDEEPLRRIISKVLKKEGYTVLCAANGGEALLLCRQHHGPIDLLITDIVMPHMSGKELADELDTQRPGLKVLFISGYSDDAVVHRGHLEADTPFLQKPFDSKELLVKVREVLAGP